VDFPDGPAYIGPCVLSSKPTAPESVAFLTYASSLWAESMSTLGGGEDLSKLPRGFETIELGMACPLIPRRRSFLASAPPAARLGFTHNFEILFEFEHLVKALTHNLWSSASKTVIFFINSQVPGGGFRAFVM